MKAHRAVTLTPLAALAAVALVAQTAPARLDWKAIDEETMRHYQALVRFDTTSKERPAAEYIKQVLDQNGIPAQILALESELYRFVRLNWDVVTGLAKAR